MKSVSMSVFILISFLVSCHPNEAEISAMNEINRVLSERVNELMQENHRIVIRIENTLAQMGVPADKIAMRKEAEAIRKESQLLHNYFLMILDSVNRNYLNHAQEISLLKTHRSLIRKKAENFIQLLAPVREKIKIDSICPETCLSQRLNGQVLMVELNTLFLKLLRLENQALTKIRKKLGEVQIRYGKLHPYVIPASDVLEEGQEYVAKIGVATLPVSSSFIATLKMRVEGKPVPVDSNGMGEIAFIAKADKFDSKGMAIKSWKGEVVVNIRGKDSTFSFQENYVVKQKCRVEK